MSEIIKLFKTSSVYSLSNTVNGLLTMATFFVLARELTAAEIGYLELFTSLIPLFLVIADSGMLSALSYYYYNETNDDMRKKYLSCAYWFEFFVTCSIIGLLLVFNKHAVRFLELSGDAKIYFYCTLLLILLEVNFSFIQNLFRLRFEYVRNVALSVSRNLIIALPVVVLYYFNRKIDLLAYFLFLLVGILVPVMVPALIGFKKVLVGFDRDVFKRMFRYGRPLLLGNASVYFISYVDRLIIQKLASTDELGYYAIGLKIALISSLFISGFQYAWAPSMLKNALENKNTEIIKDAIQYYLLITLAIFFVVSCFSKELIWLLAGEKYISSARVVGFLIIATMAYGAYNILHSGIVLGRRLVYHSFILITAGLGNIIFNILFVQRWGIVGAAGAMALTGIATASLGYYYSQKAYSVKYDIQKILVTLVFLILSEYLVFKVSLLSLQIRLFVSLGGILITLLIYKKESQRFISYFKKMKQRFFAA